ncbi:MAG TPA: histidine phosphatase family protein [Xanthobacteraceae bacterium]|nr:histidine phosphatase family protein [Xanthobacteraceae bacterium]
MRRLMLLRHAKSDRTRPDAPDHARPLAPRGREAAPRLGVYMVHHGLMPDLVLCSTAARTRETWDLVEKAFANKPPVVYEERLYETGASALFDVVKETKSSVHALLLAGHNPGLHDLAQRLIASGDTDARARLTEKFPTGALAVIDFAVDDWRKLHPRSGRLDRLVVPRMLEATTD